MAPPCKKIKYKGRRRSKPVVRPKKRVPPPAETNSPTPRSELGEQLYFAPEEDIEGPGEVIITPKSPVEGFREWVQKQRFIPQDLSDDFLLFFLSASGYFLDSAKELLQKYFDSRREPSPLFRDRDPLSSANARIFNKLYVLPVPDTTEDGRKIILTGLLEPTLHYNQFEHVKALALVIDLLIWEKDFGFGDFEIVLDGRGFECLQLLENKVYDHRSIKSLLLDTIPGSLRSFYLLYPPPHVANIADNRNGIWVTVVRTKQEMIRHLPADILPLEYGGNLGHLGDLVEQWELHMIQSREFFIQFEKKMINDHRRKLCYELEISKGKNWVQLMKLEEDEWEYKTQYYERMKNRKNTKPLKHPAFGSQRWLMKPKKQKVVNPRSKCLKRAREEEANTFAPTPFYNGYAKEIQRAKLEAEREAALRCCAQPPILELEICYY